MKNLPNKKSQSKKLEKIVGLAFISFVIILVASFTYLVIDFSTDIFSSYVEDVEEIVQIRVEELFPSYHDLVEYEKFDFCSAPRDEWEVIKTDISIYTRQIKVVDCYRKYTMIK